MPPIPQFAKVLAKRAKADPKVISGGTLVKSKKCKLSLTNKSSVGSVRFAKDNRQFIEIKKEFEPFIKKTKVNMELLKIREKEIKEIEEFLPKDIVKKLNTLVTQARHLGKSGFTKISDREMIQRIGNLRSFFDGIESSIEDLEVKTPMFEYVENINRLLSDIHSSNDMRPTIIDKIKNIVEAINKESTKAEG